jgi:pilus assembly protein Flp/PilA
MNTMLLKLYVKFQDLASREEGQDLVEYALVVALIAFGATAGMKAACQGPEHRLQQHQQHSRHLR